LTELNDSIIAHCPVGTIASFVTTSYGRVMVDHGPITDNSYSTSYQENYNSPVYTIVEIKPDIDSIRLMSYSAGGSG
jgi:hypothetical protein